MHRHVLLEAGSVAIVTLNRPAQKNAIGPQLRKELAAVLHHIRADDAVRAVVLAGSGGAFCAGTDVKEWLAADAPAQARIKASNSDVIDLWRDLGKPTVAAVDGPAFGLGFLLALRSDLVVATGRASFAMPERKLGITVPDADDWHTRFGRQRATEVLVECATLSAQTGAKWGFVNQVVEPPEGMLALARLRAERCFS